MFDRVLNVLKQVVSKFYELNLRAKGLLIKTLGKFDGLGQLT